MDSFDIEYLKSHFIYKAKSVAIGLGISEEHIMKAIESIHPIIPKVEDILSYCGKIQIASLTKLHFSVDQVMKAMQELKTIDLETLIMHLTFEQTKKLLEIGLTTTDISTTIMEIGSFDYYRLLH